jgi:hypothetical protein
MTGNLTFSYGGAILGNVAQNQIALTSNAISDLSGFVAYGDGAAQIYANTLIQLVANTGGVTTSIWNFNANGSLKFPDNTIQTTAYVPNDEVDNVARASVQAAYNQANVTIGVDATQNTRITVIEDTDLSQNVRLIFSNTRMTIIEGVDTSQNARMTIIEGNDASQNVRLDYSNTAITIIQGTDTSQNARMTIIEGTNVTQNTNIASTDNKMQYAYGQANTGTVLAQATYNQANVTIGVDATQNTNIASTDNKMQYAYGQANTGTVLAQASYNFANNISASLSGNSIILGANTTGLLVSNAVTMTSSTYITNGIAQLNQVLGKLVPASPPNFPGSYSAITISSLIGPYRMTNFVQQDNSANSRSVNGGTSTTVLRTSSYTTSSIINVGPGDSGALTVYKNNISSGTRTLAAGNGNAGTYNDLVILNNVDYATITGAAPGFWSSMNVRASGTVSNGWNEVYISDSVTDRTDVAYWYYDNSAPGSPTFAGASIVPLSEVLTYSSTVPHYTSSTTFKLGVNVSKLSGDMFPASNTFFTGTAGGAFGAPSSNTYPTVGITYPLARNLYVSSGSVTVNTTSTIISGIGSSATGPSVTVDNSYSTASQVFTTALANTILYKTGSSSSNTVICEDTIFFAQTVGSGSGLAARIINPGTTDTPTQSASATLFNSQTGTLTANDATVVASTLKHDQVNYSSSYLPSGPNLSSGRTGAQYFTFRFVRTSVSKFDIMFTGTIAGLWVAVPGSAIDTAAAASNGWMAMSSAYGGSGVPTSGCALGGVVTLNSGVTNHRKTCTFGTVSSSDTGTNEIYVRIKLTSGQTVTGLSILSASN